MSEERHIKGIKDSDKRKRYGKYAKYFELVEKYGGGLGRWEKKNRRLLRSLTRQS